jgi:myxalamid-type polyketide synthase MxaE and MxaD
MEQPADRKEMLKQSLLKIRRLQARVDAFEQAQHAPIAIVGMACRYPGGANNPDQFWHLLRDGVDAIVQVPENRWRAADYFDADPSAVGKAYVTQGGFLDDVESFDAAFFEISHTEARQMDPQQRLLLQVSWEALEHAGLAPDQLKGTRTGAFVGLTASDFLLMSFDGATYDIDPYLASGSSHAVAAGRLAYFLGLQGPAMTIDTACSAALVSVHQACMSLRTGESDVALAGGALLILSPFGHISACKGGMLSPAGRCKTFDASADGYVRAEGVGMLVLKRLKDAEAQGDNILAVIRGTACNQDGRSGGLTAPNGKSQEAVIMQALADARVMPAEVAYVETHGTGTSLGDPIEVQALGAVHANQRDSDKPLLIGSVKTNIGHTEALAGVAGLMKVVLALQHQQIPPHLHCKKPNPHISWADIPCRRRK